jgi:hypothetical protein
MRNLKILVRVMFCIGLLVMTMWIYVQPNSALDCESDRWDAFMSANDTYTTTFRSWYFGDPVSCQTTCTQSCNGSSDPQCVSNCVSSCDTTRYNDFTTAQNGLVSAASQPCPINPDYCDNARYQNDLCNLQYTNYIENPVIDPETGEWDQEWFSMVMTEGQSCTRASGIDNCR